MYLYRAVDSHGKTIECLLSATRDAQAAKRFLQRRLALVTAEQDHRFIKQLVKPGMGFFSFQTACNMLQGYESVHMLRKEQMYGIEKGNITGQISFIARLFGLVAKAQSETRLTSIVPL